MANTKGEIEFVISVTNPVGTDKAVKKIVGSIDEIQRVVDKLNVNSFGTQLNLLDKDIAAIKQSFAANKKVIKESNGGFISLTRTAKGFAKVLRNGVQQFEKLRPGKSNLVKFGDQVAAMSTGILRFGRANRKVTKTTGALSRQLQQTFTKQQSALINQYTNRISSLRSRMAVAGDASGQTSKKIAILSKSLGQLARVKVADILPGIGNTTRSQLAQANTAIKTFFNQQKGNFQGLSGAPVGGAGGAFGGGVAKDLKRTGAALSGAIGFGAVTAGIEIQQLFRDRRLKNQLSQGTRSIASTIGGLFGSAIGNIAGDIGEAAGTVGELIINAFSLQVRLVGSAVGAAVRGLGLLVISGFFAGIAAGGAGLTLVPVFTALLIPALFVLITLVNDVVNELLDVAQKLFKSLINIIGAGLKTLALIIGAGLKIIFKVWTAIWTSFKEVVKIAMESVVAITKTGIKLITTLAKNGIKDFLALQQGASRAAKELANQGDKIKQITSEINRIRISFGFEKKDVADAFFNTISAGFRTTAERIRITSAASKLALADQSSLANATNALITVYANYGEKLSDIERISRLLSTATTIGVTSVEELGPALRNVVGIAKFAGVSLEDLLGAVAALTQVFGKGSTRSVTRFFSRFIEAIANPTSRARKEFEKLGVSISDLQGGSFTDKFTNLLDKLKGINPDQLRDFFPTVQSRRAFAGLTQDVNRFRKVLGQIAKLNRIQGKQTGLLFKQMFQRVKQIAQITQIARERFGELFATIARITVVSDKFFDVMLQIGVILSSTKFTDSIEKLAKFVAIIVQPLGSKLLPGFKSLRDTIREIALFDPFKSAAAKELGVNLRNIVKTVSEYLSGIINADNAGKLLRTTFNGIATAVDEISNAISDFQFGLLSFDNIIKGFEELKKIGTDFAFNGLIKGLSEITLGINQITAVTANLNLNDAFGGKLKGRPLQAFEAFKALFKSIARLGTTVFKQLIDEVAESFRASFVNSTNIVVEKIKGLIKILLIAVRTFEFLSNIAIADAAFVPTERKKIGLLTTPQSKGRLDFAKQFPELAKDLKGPFEIEKQLRNIGIDVGIADIIEAITDATQRDLLRKPLEAKIALKVVGAEEVEREIEKVFKAFSKLITFEIKQARETSFGKNILRVPGLAQGLAQERLAADPNVLKRIGRISIADIIERQLLTGGKGDTGGIARSATEKRADQVRITSELIKSSSNAQSALFDANAELAKNTEELRKSRLARKGIDVKQNFIQRQADSKALTKKLGDVDVRAKTLRDIQVKAFRSRTQSRKTTELRIARIRARSDQLKAKLRKTGVKGVIPVAAKDGEQGITGVSGRPGATGKRKRQVSPSAIQNPIMVETINIVPKRFTEGPKIAGQNVVSADIAQMIEEGLTSFLIRLPKGKSTLNAGFQGRAPQTDRKLFTRSGRLKGKRSDITSGLASFLSQPMPITRGVKRIRRGQSLFDTDTRTPGAALGSRFGGQTALGIARGNRGGGRVRPLESRVLTDKQSPEEQQRQAIDKNTQATMENSRKAAINNAKLEDNTQATNNLAVAIRNRTNEEKFASQAVPGGGIGSPRLPGDPPTVQNDGN